MAEEEIDVGALFLEQELAKKKLPFNYKRNSPEKLRVRSLTSDEATALKRGPLDDSYVQTVAKRGLEKS